MIPRYVDIWIVSKNVDIFILRHLLLSNRSLRRTLPLLDTEMTWMMGSMMTRTLMKQPISRLPSVISGGQSVLYRISSRRHSLPHCPPQCPDHSAHLLLAPPPYISILTPCYDTKLSTMSPRSFVCLTCEQHSPITFNGRVRLFKNSTS